MIPTGHPKSAVRYLPYARTQTRTRAARRAGVHGGAQAAIPCKPSVQAVQARPQYTYYAEGGRPRTQVRWGAHHPFEQARTPVQLTVE